MGASFVLFILAVFIILGCGAWILGRE